MNEICWKIGSFIIVRVRTRNLVVRGCRRSFHSVIGDAKPPFPPVFGEKTYIFQSTWIIFFFEIQYYLGFLDLIYITMCKKFGIAWKHMYLSPHFFEKVFWKLFSFDFHLSLLKLIKHSKYQIIWFQIANFGIFRQNKCAKSLQFNDFETFINEK